MNLNRFTQAISGFEKAPPGNKPWLPDAPYAVRQTPGGEGYREHDERTFGHSLREIDKKARRID